MKTKTLRPWSIIARRELASYFQSPVAYIVTALFLLFSGIHIVTDLSEPTHPKIGSSRKLAEAGIEKRVL